MTVDLTYKMLSYQLIHSFNSDECVDWAIQLLSKDIESPSIRILAGLDKPSNHFETINYLKKALDELGISNSKWNNSIIPYYYYLISKIANSVNIIDNLKELKYLCVENENDKSIFDFALLYWAWDDFNYGESSHYWDGATKENISEIVVKTANDWINKNKVELELKLNK